MKTILHRAARFAACLLAAAVIAGLRSAFPAESPPDPAPRPFALDGIWFYDRDMQKVIPEIDTEWLTVVFHPPPPDAAAPADDSAHAAALRAAAGRIEAGSGLITGHLLHDDPGENACFFRIAAGTPVAAIQTLAAEISRRGEVRYTHPALRIGGKSFGFLDTFDMRWKTGADPALKTRILAQAHAVPVGGKDPDGYRVDLFSRPFSRPFFTAVNLLAEDLNTRWAVPRLVPLAPRCSVVFETAVSGGRVGDGIPFVVIIRFSDQARIDPSAVNGLEIHPAGIAGRLFDAVVDVPADLDLTRSPVRISGSMVFYAPGLYTIPPVRVPYVCEDCPGRPVRTAVSRAAAVHVASMVAPAAPEQGRAPTLVLPGADPEPDLPGLLPGGRPATALAAAMAAFLAAAGCLVLAFRLLAARRRAHQDRQPADTAAHLASDLRALLQEAPGCHWHYMVRVGRGLRRYLAGAYAIETCPVGGTGRIFFQAAADRLSECLAPVVRRALDRIDDAASREASVYPEMDRFLEDVRIILEHGEG